MTHSPGCNRGGWPRAGGEGEEGGAELHNLCLKSFSSSSSSETFFNQPVCNVYFQISWATFFSIAQNGSHGGVGKGTSSKYLCLKSHLLLLSYNSKNQFSICNDQETIVVFCISSKVKAGAFNLEILSVFQRKEENFLLKPSLLSFITHFCTC